MARGVVSTPLSPSEVMSDLRTTLFEALQIWTHVVVAPTPALFLPLWDTRRRSARWSLLEQCGRNEGDTSLGSSSPIHPTPKLTASISTHDHNLGSSDAHQPQITPFVLQVVIHFDHSWRLLRSACLGVREIKSSLPSCVQSSLCCYDLALLTCRRASSNLT